MNTHQQVAVKSQTPFWKQTEESITSNDVIKAYESGKEKGFQQYLELRSKIYHNNLNRTFKVTEKAALSLLQKKIGVELITMKSENAENFHVIFALAKESFYDKEIRRLSYSILKELRKEHMDDLFSLELTIMNHGNDLNEDELASDGFIWGFDLDLFIKEHPVGS